MAADDLVMRWYLRGDFSLDAAKAVCGEVEELTEGPVITAPMTGAAAKEAAKALGAAAMLRVL